MKLGLGLPQNGMMNLHHDVPHVAKAAEAAGYASLWVLERNLVPVEPTQGLYGVPGLSWPDSYQHVADGLTVLTAAGAVTNQVNLGTSVLVAPLHVPNELARRLATLDLLSDGRVIAGFGSGWSIDEYAAAGMDISTRREALDEVIDVCRAVWGPDPVTFKGRRTVIDNANVGPKPKRDIPIVLGGGASAQALDRIARKADGWMPVGPTGPALKEQFQRLREAATDAGRDGDALRLIPRANIELSEAPLGADRYPLAGSLDQVIEDLVGLVDTGADEVIVELAPSVRDGAELLDRALEVKDRLTAAGV